MATGTLTIERLPPVAGILPSTLERMLRAMVVANLLRKGRPGGGKKGGAAHFELLELAYIMFGFAGLQPSDAPRAVMMLRGLPYYGSIDPSDEAMPPLPTLEDQIAHSIYGAGGARRNNATWFPDAVAALRSWELQMSLDPVFAVIQVDTTAGQSRHIYSVDPNPRPGLRRQTILSGDVLMAMGELYADTEKQLAVIQPTFLNPSSAKTTPESNDAGNLRQEVPASMSDQPTPMGPAASTPRKVSAKTKIFKDAPSAGLVTADE